MSYTGLVMSHLGARVIVWLKGWLFVGATISAVLLSVCALNPGHPLAELSRRAALFTAMLCVVSRVVLYCICRRQAN